MKSAPQISAEISPEAQDLINQEVAHLESVYASLENQKMHAIQRHRTEELRSRELTSEYIATTRLEDKVQISSDESISHSLKDLKSDEITSLEELLKKPYFARIELAEEMPNGSIKNINYKIGYTSNIDCRIIDWRKAPISKLYYEYKEGDEYSEMIQNQERLGKVTLRNTLDILQNNLRRVTCRYGDFQFKNQTWQQLNNGLRSRSQDSGSQLPNILSLITAEQFRLITEEASTAVLIQGIAGSGKTTVALHRLAWLLHKDNSDLKPEQCLVLVPNNTLKTYVSKTLPSMEVYGVRIASFVEWTAEIVTQAFKSAGRQIKIIKPSNPTASSQRRLKSTDGLFLVLEDFVLEQRHNLIDFLQKNLNWNELPLGITSSFEKIKSQVKGSVGLVQEMLAAIESGIKNISPSNEKFQGLNKAKEVLTVALRRIQLYDQDLIKLLSLTQKIIEQDRSKLIDRELINATYEQVKSNLNQTDQNELVLDALDLSLLARIIQLKNNAIFLKDGSKNRYGHIVIDEVQDLSLAEFALVLGSVTASKNLTIVGDVGQSIDRDKSFAGWEALSSQGQLDSGNSKYVSLTVSHRSSVEIMRFAEFVLGRQQPITGRQGRVPIWFKCANEEYAIQETIKWLSKAFEKYPTSLTAVICPTPSEAKMLVSFLTPTFNSAVRLGDADSFSFDSGIVVTDVTQVKGLEFVSVLVWNPSQQFFADNQHSRNLLYVALSRAEENLCIVSHDKISKTFPDFNSKLVRGVKIPEYEEEASEPEPQLEYYDE